MTVAEQNVETNPASLYRCLYYSRACRPFPEQELSRLEQLCVEKNAEHKITGYLVYYEESFVQYIEGSKRDVCTLMNSIDQDERHIIKVRLEEYMDTNRLFPRWYMRFFTRLSDADMEGVLFVHLATMSQFRQDQDSERVAWNLVDIMQQVCRVASADWQKPGLSRGGIN